MKLPLPPLLVITDRHQARVSLEDVAAELFAGGCRWLSLREKDLPPPERLALLRRLAAAGAPWGAMVMVHDDLAAAKACATGVHLPAGASVQDARRLLGDGVLIGQSAHDAGEIARAAQAGVDYVTLSPIFVTESKPGYGPALGLAVLGRAWPTPVLALGGIDESNIGACVAAGAAGAAVMGGAMRASAPRAFMASLLSRLAANVAAEPGAAHS